MSKSASNAVYPHLHPVRNALSAVRDDVPNAARLVNQALLDLVPDPDRFDRDERYRKRIERLLDTYEDAVKDLKAAVEAAYHAESVARNAALTAARKIAHDS